MRGATGRVIRIEPAYHCFNPRPSCEGRPAIQATSDALGQFQSTPLMRGATRIRRRGNALEVVSIHAPHARGDLTSWTASRPRSCFNPRPSCEGRLGRRDGGGDRARVSIHAPHARGDSSSWPPPSSRSCFNPRPSCEGRHRTDRTNIHPSVFQSTPLMRGATKTGTEIGHHLLVSIHAPHARGDE